MKIIQGAVAAVAFASMAAGPAAAKPLPAGGVTAAEVAEILQAAGYRAKLSKDDTGDPMIESGLDGSNFQVMFYGCRSGGRCGSIAFVYGVDLEDGQSLEKINLWNRDNRFGAAHLDAEMDPFITMDVDLERGGSTDTISLYLETWEGLLPAFKAFID